MTNQMSVQKYINNDSIQTRISKLLDKRAGQFTTSLLTAVNSNDKLAKCKPETVLNAALTAASMDLPINQNLGFAALVPYGDECQFQMQYKGFIQLAQRSGLYQTISAAAVYNGQLVSNDPLRGLVFDWTVEAEGEPIGYASFFKLLNGFEKTFYMISAQVLAHAKKYSKAYQYDLRSKEASSPWSTNFESMALKTVLKLLISKYGPQSTEMQTAVEYDQAIITDDGTKYIDVDADLEDEKATEQEKDEIVAANTPTEEAKDITPAETVKEKAERRYVRHDVDSKKDREEDQELLEGLRDKDGEE